MTDHAPAALVSAAAAEMDGIYRWQRYIYDLTRKYYLLGRDRLIADLDAGNGESVLEIGCGTGRNLVAAARRFRTARLHGFDISSAMLDTARRSLKRSGLGQRVTLGCADATLFQAAMFGRPHFDRLYLSYTLSMIPGWRQALERAALAIAPGGKLMIVDFGQQERLPLWFKALLFAWLRRFHVHPQAELPQVLAALADRHGLTLDCRQLYRGYAFSAVLSRPSSLS